MRGGAGLGRKSNSASRRSALAFFSFRVDRRLRHGETNKQLCRTRHIPSTSPASTRHNHHLLNYSARSPCSFPHPLHLHPYPRASRHTALDEDLGTLLSAVVHTPSSMPPPVASNMRGGSLFRATLLTPVLRSHVNVQTPMCPSIRVFKSFPSFSTTDDPQTVQSPYRSQAHLQTNQELVISGLAMGNSGRRT